MSSPEQPAHPLPLSKAEKQLARNLTQLLRHGKPRKLTSLRPDGFVSLAEVQTVPAFATLTVPLAHAIVAEDNKQRFALRHEGSEVASVADGTNVAGWWMRANQGHTLTGLDPEQLLKRIEDSSQLPCVVHGTYLAAWPTIRTLGLSRMKRNHVHFASGLPGGVGPKVISGMRASAEVLVYVDAAKAMQLGVVFFVSENGVILTPGVGPQGTVPPEAFAQVIDAATGTDLLLQDGSSALASMPAGAAEEASELPEGDANSASEVATGNIIGNKRKGKGNGNRNGKGMGKGKGDLLNLISRKGKGKGGGSKGGKGRKGSWPEFLGQPGDAAVKAIAAAAPGLKVMKVPEGSMVTMDHRLDRVRVYVGSDGKVTRPPHLG